VPGLMTYIWEGGAFVEFKTADELQTQIELCRAAGFDDFCIFDHGTQFCRISDEQAEMLCEYAIQEDLLMSIVNDLQAVEMQLRAVAAELLVQADVIAAKIAELQALDDQLDVVADLIDVD